MFRCRKENGCIFKDLNINLIRVVLARVDCLFTFQLKRGQEWWAALNNLKCALLQRFCWAFDVRNCTTIVNIGYLCFCNESLHGILWVSLKNSLQTRGRTHSNIGVVNVKQNTICPVYFLILYYGCSSFADLISQNGVDRVLIHYL